MNNRSIQMKLGIGAIVAAVVLLVFAIPAWVSSPSNVSNIVLSPTFWPNTLAALTGLTGVGLILSSLGHPKSVMSEPSDVDDRQAAFLRLAMLCAVMGLTIYAMPRLGLVWTAMLVFAAVAFLVRTRNPKTAMICAVLGPLVLYVFFAHVASVAIPQGNFVRLP